MIRFMLLSLALAAVGFFAILIYRRAVADPDSIPTNTAGTSVSTILAQMNEPRPLPMGQKEFMAWSDRVLSGALVPTDDKEGLRAILASMILQLPSTVSHKEDAFFIHSLRKAAANEVAHANFQAIKKKKEEDAKAAKETPTAS